MSDILNEALKACNQHSVAFCKFLSANDAGSTGTHQAGIYIPHNAYTILFESPGEKGTNKDKKNVKILWQNDFFTENRFIYYGQKTRNEYRITRFGRGFPYLRDEHIGDLFVLVQVEEYSYLAYILSSDEEIESFLEYFGMSPTDTNRIFKIDFNHQGTEYLFSQFINKLTVDFPETKDMAAVARQIYAKIHTEKISGDVDALLLGWLDMEYSLFRAIERDRYGYLLSENFSSIDEYISNANKILNRRKSRAGKSLEHHLSEIFTINKVPFDSQAITEGNKRPDFIFPGAEAYHNVTFDSKNLSFLGAKTTCKDRWRQILNEADRIPEKHLFTLQQGISANQLKEMHENRVVLVVPKKYISSFPPIYRQKILTLGSFIAMLKEKLDLF